MGCIAKSMKIGSLGLVLVLAATMIAAQPRAGQSGQSAGQSSQSGMTQGSQDQGRSTGLQQSQPSDQSQQSQMSSQFQPQLQRVDQLMGTDVTNDQGQKLGKVEDIVLDSRDRTINYVVVSYDGSLGMGNKLFAVPWSAIKMDAQKKHFVVNVSTDRIKSAPSFDKSHWPNMSDPGWKQQETSFFQSAGQSSGASSSQSSAMPSTSSRPSASATGQSGTSDQSAAGSRQRPSATTPGQAASGQPLTIKYRKVSDLIGMPAKTAQNEDVGDLDDMVIDTNQGRVAFGVFTVKSGFLGMGKEMALIPWTSIQVQPSSNDLRVNADKQTIDAAAFAANRFPDLQNKQYTQDLYKRFEATPYWEALGYTPGTEQPSATSMTAATQGRDPSAWKPDSDYNKKFDASKITTVSGTIQSAGTFSPAANAIPGVRLQIKSDDGKTHTVQLGPRPYVDQQGIDMRNGDQATVTGAQADFNGRSVIIASKIESGGKTIELRDAQGKPKWNADELTSMMQQEQSSSQPGSQQPSSTTPGTPQQPSTTPGQSTRPGPSQNPNY